MFELTINEELALKSMERLEYDDNGILDTQYNRWIIEFIIAVFEVSPYELAKKVWNYYSNHPEQNKTES